MGKGRGGIGREARQPKKKRPRKVKEEKQNNSAPFAFSSGQPMLLCCLRLLVKMFCMFSGGCPVCVQSDRHIRSFLSVGVDDFVSLRATQFNSLRSHALLLPEVLVWLRCLGHCIRADI